MEITHANISERIAFLEDEARTLRARHEKELDSLVELCSGLGHRFGVVRKVTRLDFLVADDQPNHFDMEVRECCVCGHEHEVVLRAYRPIPVPPSGSFVVRERPVRRA